MCAWCLYCTCQRSVLEEAEHAINELEKSLGLFVPLFPYHLCKSCIPCQAWNVPKLTFVIKLQPRFIYCKKGVLQTHSFQWILFYWRITLNIVGKAGLQMNPQIILSNYFHWDLLASSPPPMPPQPFWQEGGRSLLQPWIQPHSPHPFKRSTSFPFVLTWRHHSLSSFILKSTLLFQLC